MIRPKRGGYEVVVYYGRDAAGRRQSRSQMAPTKRAAQALERKLLNERDAGRSNDGGRATLAQLIDQWLDVAQVEGSTRYQAERRLCRYVVPELGKVRVERLRVEDLDLFYRRLQRGDAGRGQKPLAPATIRRVHADLRSVLNLAIDWGWIATNPCARAHPPAVTPPDPVAPPTSALKGLMAYLAEHHQALAVYVRLVSVTGMRRSEACALRRSDVDLEAQAIRRARALGVGRGAAYEKPTKTRKANRLAIDAETARVLKDHLDEQAATALACNHRIGDDAYVFTLDPAGERPWQPGWVSHRFAAQRAHVPGAEDVTLRALRHWMITEGLENEFSAKTVSGRAGHSRPSVTLDVYAGHVPMSDRALADHLGSLL